jgi:hypothetical protein
LGKKGKGRSLVPLTKAWKIANDNFESLLDKDTKIFQNMALWF